MKEVWKALGPVRTRIRRNRFLRGCAAGLAAGLGAAVLLQAAAFFVPIPDRALWAAALAAAALLLVPPGNALRPVSNQEAAEAADACGLQERAITALEAGDTEMHRLQRQDACAALAKLDVRQIRPGSVKKALLAALGCMLLLCGMLLIPSPRDPDAAARKALVRTLREGRETIERAAEEDAESLPEERKSELRKITADLKRELNESRDAADALVALDKAEQRLEQLRQQTAGNAAAATESMGGESASQAAGNGEGSQAQAGTEENTMVQAGDGRESNGPAGDRATGGELKTLEALAALQGAVNPSAGMEWPNLQNMAGRQGNPEGKNGNASSGGGTGRQEDKTGGGAGTGSTNEEQEGCGENNGTHSAGSRDPQYKEEKYETIYDPERIDLAAQDVTTEQERLGDDGSQQLETGPGRGTLSGNVPWNEALHDYAETEARAAEHENLTVQERQWVDEYFALLTEQE